jgi:segregation and condensation protein A
MPELRTTTAAQVDAAAQIAPDGPQPQTDLAPLTQQQPLPLAYVRGEPVLQVPADLYIPPDALEVLLESFAGPLDFLLYLIKKQKLNILDLPVFAISQQYMTYIDLMQQLNFELAAEYLVMAAMLAEIKSRLLLPSLQQTNDIESDPRAELVRRLLEYERFSQAASALDDLPRQERDVFRPLVTAVLTVDGSAPMAAPPSVTLADLVEAATAMMSRWQAQGSAQVHHQVTREILSTRARMSHILALLDDSPLLDFTACFTQEEGRAGVVVTLLALLELVKSQLIILTQSQHYGQIHLQLA